MLYFFRIIQQIENYEGVESTVKKSIRNILIGITVIIAVGMALSLSACNNNENNAEIKSLYAQGLDVVQLMSEITQTEECVDIFTTSNESKP